MFATGRKGVLSFVLFNDAWFQKGHSASNTSYTRIKLHIMYIIITYYSHIYYHILSFISITSLFILSYIGLLL